MKIQLTFKDPDGVYDSVNMAVRDSLQEVEGLTEKEKDFLQEERFNATMEWLSEHWCRWGEYLDVVIDTEENTATVIKMK